MPRVIQCEDNSTLVLGDCVDAIAADGFEPGDRNSVDRAASYLCRLGNDRDFLGDILIDQLCTTGGNDLTNSAYGAQAIMLSDARHGFFLRANIWPAKNDPIFQASGGHSFSYGTPHDHNFDFLTLGYFGPGYASDYYEYDHDAVAGFVGEKAGLRFVERSTLDPGKIMHYRAHLDVHGQRPPDSMSVSLNIMAIDPRQAWRDQYVFDTDADTITGVLNPTSTEVYLRLAVGLGGENALDLAENFGRMHRSDRLRLASFEARSLLCDDAQQEDTLWRQAELSGSRLLTHEAQQRRAALA
ncbi:transposase [Pontixanthobacter sp. CEM42]|uniref:transposase n=1 Tax=Pontixanthobacter sp. CEM42 TaxID=2792077 RepID=UPI001ADFB601|nr:transposase [Pontixanthobacter sp. CEM42]